MDRVPINPGKVDWSGENPGMYLKKTADGPFVTLISFFRVVVSPKGRGHAAFILQDPYGEGKDPGKECVACESIEDYEREEKLSEVLAVALRA